MFVCCIIKNITNLEQCANKAEHMEEEPDTAAQAALDFTHTAILD
jgi:hypothetical protein